MVTISSDLAWALGMVPDCLVPTDGDAPHFRDEYGGGWFWYRETVEGPKRVLIDAKKYELIRLVQIHPKRTDNGTA